MSGGVPAAPLATRCLCHPRSWAGRTPWDRSSCRPWSLGPAVPLSSASQALQPLGSAAALSPSLLRPGFTAPRVTETVRSDSAVSWRTFSIVVGIEPQLPRRVAGPLRRPHHVPPASPAPLLQPPLPPSPGVPCLPCAVHRCSVPSEFTARAPHTLGDSTGSCPPSTRQLSHRSHAQSLRPGPQLAVMCIAVIQREGRLPAQGVPHSVVCDSARVDPCRYSGLPTWRVTRARVAKQFITRVGKPCSSVRKHCCNSKVRRKGNEVTRVL